MHRFLLFLIIIFVFSFSCRSQETKACQILADSLKECDEIQYAAMQLIPLYYQDGIIDTAEMLLNYWEMHCGTDETIFRTKVLWAIDSGCFSDTLIDESIIGYLDLYQWFCQDTTGESMEAYSYYTPEFPLLIWYRTFTDKIVERAINYPDLSETERFFVRFYHSPADSIYQTLESKALNDSKIALIFKQPVNGKLPEWIFHGAFAGGMWIPEDKLSTLGLHPSIGAYAGFRHNKMLYNLGLNFRVGSSANDINVLYKDSLYTTDNFMGINVSLEAGRHLVNWRRHEFDLLFGIDLETVNVLSLKNDPDNADDDESKYLTSPSMHVGAGYRFYLKNSRYLGLSSRFQFLNLKNTGGTNLRGNALTISLEYGFSSNPWLNKQNTYLKQRLPEK